MEVGIGRAETDRLTAIRNIAALLALADEAHDPAWRAEALLWQLRLLNALGDHTGMLPLADEVIQTARVVKQIGLEAQALCLKAAALTRLGEAAAQQTVEEAIACGRVAADEWVIAYASGMLALHESYAGDYARAAQLWTEVFDMVKRSGDRTLESRALSNLGPLINTWANTFRRGPISNKGLRCANSSAIGAVMPITS